MDQIVVRYKEEDPDASDRWVLQTPIEYQTPAGTVIVPAGYQTDFASVPPWLWSVFPPIGRHNRACVLHDYWYDQRLFEADLGQRAARLAADRELLRRLLLDAPGHRLRHYLMFWAVRIGGRSWWIN